MGKIWIQDGKNSDPALYNTRTKTDPNAHLCCLLADIAEPLVITAAAHERLGRELTARRPGRTPVLPAAALLTLLPLFLPLRENQKSVLNLSQINSVVYSFSRIR
jgi:hypothetical protein